MSMLQSTLFLNDVNITDFENKETNVEYTRYIICNGLMHVVFLVLKTPVFPFHLILFGIKHCNTLKLIILHGIIMFCRQLRRSALY